MQISAAGRAFIKKWEGLYLKAYDDGGGTWTIGWGHIKGVRPGMTCTVEQAEQWLTEDIAEAEAAVARVLKVPVTQGQWDVLVSFTMNLGGEALASSTLLRQLNAGDYASVRVQLLRWVYDDPDGAGPLPPKVVQGLVNRRNEEAQMWTAVSAPVNPVDPNGSRTLNGGTVATAGGAVIAAEQVREIAQEAQWSLGSSQTIMAILGVVIVVAGIWVLYARLDDAGLIPWKRKHVPNSGSDNRVIPIEQPVPVVPEDAGRVAGDVQDNGGNVG